MKFFLFIEELAQSLEESNLDHVHNDHDHGHGHDHGHDHGHEQGQGHDHCQGHGHHHDHDPKSTKSKCSSTAKDQSKQPLQHQNMPSKKATTAKELRDLMYQHYCVGKGKITFT